MTTPASGLTLIERYYAINQALKAYLVSLDLNCPVVKYGIDPAVLKRTWRGQVYDRYPYIQTYFTNVDEQQWTSYDAGILTEWDFQVSFFTAPRTETVNDADFFKPFNAVKSGLSNRRLNLLQTTSEDGKVTTLADIYQPFKSHYEFEVKSGNTVPSAWMICKMRAVCGYGQNLAEPDPTLSTDLDNAITYENIEV